MVVLLLQVGNSSYLQCAASHAESPASSKEPEQPSPISVLEAPFVEDVSSGSECFERVSAELHGENLYVVPNSLHTIYISSVCLSS